MMTTTWQRGRVAIGFTTDDVHERNEFFASLRDLARAEGLREIGLEREGKSSTFVLSLAVGDERRDRVEAALQTFATRSFARTRL
jgi:hypothetical protein